MRMFLACALGAALLPSRASALDVSGDILFRGWFFGATGTVDRTDLASLDFDKAKGQPEFQGGLVLGERHHLGISYLRIRREEEGLATGTILGILRFRDDVSLDLSVDYVRGHYGYSLLANSWVDVQPFLELAYLREETTLVDHTFSQTSHQEDSAVFPLPGAELVFARSFPVHLRARAEGIGTGQGHLVDVEGGAEGAWGIFFAGVGYRYLDFVVDRHDVADVRLKGVYAEGGVRF